ncbi:ribosomal RNA large subunit methyltransferase J [Spirochaetia bacterium]|nr:ribosomal RNA large subunit methyltransferase J [Spirochaetia bacterium]
MLSYRHGFHAGNSADVLKHTVLIFCLDYLAQKEKPCLCIDTHAGAGSYPLPGVFSAKKREWEGGVGKLSGADSLSGNGKAPGPDRQQIPAMIRRYLDITGLSNGAATAAALSYPGSPEIIRRLLRRQDQGCCFELHPEDFAALDTLLGGDRRFTLRREDGFAGLKKLLPPLSRRGLILIDPPYEVKDDYTRLPQALSDALKRFPTGTYIIWHPLLHIDPRPGPAETASFQETLLGLYDGNRLGIELYTAPKDSPPANSPRGMYGSGLVLFNPPWTLKPALEESLPFLGEILGIGKDGWKLQ